MRIGKQGRDRGILDRLFIRRWWLIMASFGNRDRRRVLSRIRISVKERRIERANSQIVVEIVLQVLYESSAGTACSACIFERQ